MTKELNLQIPGSLFSSLDEKAKMQGVSLEALCLFTLEKSLEGEPEILTDPSLYSYMANGELRSEIQKVMQSALAQEEKKRRVHKLKTQIVRCIR